MGVGLSRTAPEAAQENCERQSGQKRQIHEKNNTLFRILPKRDTFSFISMLVAVWVLGQATKLS